MFQHDYLDLPQPGIKEDGDQMKMTWNHSSIVRCPVDGCEWATTLPKGSPLVIDLNVVPLDQANRDLRQRHEDALRDHSLHHSPMEYLRTIKRLSDEIKCVRGELSDYITELREVRTEQGLDFDNDLGYYEAILRGSRG